MVVIANIMFCLASLLSADAEADASPPDPAGIEYFERRVRPVLVERCHKCHSTMVAEPRGGLTLDNREKIVSGGDTGPAIVPGDPDKSLLIEAIRYGSESLQMPPAGKLPDSEIAIIVEWVKRGSPFPASETTSRTRRTIDFVEGRKHWAFQPLPGHTGPNQLTSGKPLSTPSVGDTSFHRGADGRVDSIVYGYLAKHDLTPAAEATRDMLIRRVTFDLLGLPPTLQEIAQFRDDPAPDAIERMIDRTLASPHYGERWGRFWLDLARYCDIPESWREGEAKAWLYRDWVVSAWNRDLAYDEFVRHQLAADLLPGATPDDNRALGFLGLSPTYWKELKLDHKVIKQVVAEEWEERIDAIGSTFMGLTIACARCHDHKFDPITTQDYYGLAGVLASICLEDRPIIPDENASPALMARKQVKELQKQIGELAKKTDPAEEIKTQTEELRRQVTDLEKTPHYHTPLVFGVVESSLQVLPDGEYKTKIEHQPGQAQDVAVQLRGNAAKTGELIPRRFLTVLSRDPEARFRQGSGRRELADAIVGDAAGLTSRVFVNRVWHQHFGRGLVTTLSNFGSQGDRPSHPELLDDLADRFATNGWSPKWLHREILLSATYRQTSVREPHKHAIDPENVWLARMKPRRLEVEALRDAVLVATGELDESMGGESVDLSRPTNRRRTIYGEVKRRELNDLLRLHDFPDPVAHSATREPTITPLQQLFALNSPFYYERSQALAERARSLEAPDDQRIAHLYAMVFGRAASSEETRWGLAFLTELRKEDPKADELWRQYAQILLSSNEFLFVD